MMQFHPDDARADRRAHHRGLPRRGRVPAQLRRPSDSSSAMRRTRWSWHRATSSRARSRRRSTPGEALDGNVLLDLRHLGAEKILERLHGTRELSMTFMGVDPIYEPIPVRPGAHYHMGGVDTDVWGLHIPRGALRRR